jgi:hypothetical protein
MQQLSDTQLIVLNIACQRQDRSIFPLPKSLKGGAVTKVIGSLLGKGLIEEVPARQVEFHPMLDDVVWRETETGERLTLIVTDAAFAALGLATDAEPANADDGLIVCKPAGQGAVAAPKNARPRKAPETSRTRGASKQDTLIEMLKRPDGATIVEIAEALGWQPHTVRGAMAGALKRRLGLTILSEQVEGRGRVYRMA